MEPIHVASDNQDTDSQSSEDDQFDQRNHDAQYEQDDERNPCYIEPPTYMSLICIFVIILWGIGFGLAASMIIRIIY